jgi:hypothetical protein
MNPSQRVRLCRRAMFSIPPIAAAMAAPRPATPQGLGGPVPNTFFEDLCFVRVLPFLYLMQRGDWRWLPTQGISRGGPLAMPNDLIRPEVGDGLARERAAAAAARSLRYQPRGEAGRGLAPRFVGLPGEEGSPRTPEDRRDTLSVPVILRVKDATEDFPTPAPRGLRVLAVADQVMLLREGHSPVSWTYAPGLVMETVTAATAEERVLQRLEAVAAQALGRIVFGP